MQELIKFFSNLENLKGKIRRGWKAHQVEQAESTASHTFRLAFLSWFLAEKKKLNLEQVIKMALIHDLCEVFSFDNTPYDPLLPKDLSTDENKAKAREILKEWPSLSLEEKQQRMEKKFEEEKQGLEKLISDLSSDLGQKFLNLWLEYEERKTEQSRFLKQADKAENLIQGLEYRDKSETIKEELWFRWSKEIFNDPLFIEFEKVMEQKFIENEKEDSDLGAILEFLLEIEKLKESPQRFWIPMDRENPGTIAEHTFRTAIMAWILAEKSEKDFNLERLLKLALVHDLGKIYIDNKADSDKQSHFSKTKKKEEILKKRREEIVSVKKLVSDLPFGLDEEIVELQRDYMTGISDEGRFARQVGQLETLLQALEYAEEDQCCPRKSWWVKSKEMIDNPLLVELLDSLDDKFYHLQKLPKREL